MLPLAEHFLRMHARSAGRPALAFGAAARAALLAHDWPGNVRELGNRVQRATLVAAFDVVTPADLDLVAESPRRAAPPAAPRPAPSAPAGAPRGKEDEVEAAAVEAALARANGVVSRAATALGMSRQALYRRMERVGVSIERRARSD